MGLKTTESAEPIRADICIVGAGPAGITVALELLSSGLRICLVEGGGREVDRASKELAKAENAGLPYYEIHEARARAFGGTSHLWQEGVGLRSRPLDPIDFEAREGVPYSGWPFGLEELEPYYQRAHELCKLGPFDYRLDGVVTEAGPQPLSFADSRVATNIFRFGETIHVFKEQFDKFARAENVRLLLESEVMELQVEAEGARIEKAVIRRRDGSPVEVSAGNFVLAAGGIENPRLLLLSRSGCSKGLGNEHDLVGRFFQEHLRIQSGVLAPHEEDLVQRIGLYQKHHVDGRLVTGVLTLTAEALRREQLLNTAVYLRPADDLVLSDVYRSLASLAQSFRSNFKVTDGHMRSHIANVLAHPMEATRAVMRARRREHVPKEYLQLSFQAEQAPTPDSRVVLGSTRDVFGRPRARLEWRVSDLDRRSVRTIQSILDEAARKSSIGKVIRPLGEETPPAPISGFWHHIGTTRMHSDPRHGVVDANCRMHSVENVFIAGSSVFPTSGCANPTLTIVAMSIRLADHLRRILGPGEASGGRLQGHAAT